VNQACIANACVPLAASCAELAGQGVAQDGAQTLHLDHDSTVPYLAYCASMATTPETYLELVNTSLDTDHLAAFNFGRIATGGNYNFANDEVTRYQRVRFDPATLQIDVTDSTFSVTSGQALPIPYVDYGFAGACGGPNGTFNIDLRGLPFKVDLTATTWTANQSSGPGVSSNPYGDSVAPSSDDQVVNGTGNGGCGAWSPLGYAITLNYLCPSGQSFCGGACIPTASDPANCGGCGIACSDTQLCSGSACVAAPASCVDVASSGTATDGDYTLYVSQKRAKPYTAYCANMATTPATYLDLVNTSLDTNQPALYNFGSFATAEFTRYQRVRFDPATLTIDTTDNAFSVTNGQQFPAGPYMYFAFAGACGGPDGTFDIDLRGMPFAVDTTATTWTANQADGPDVSSGPYDDSTTPSSNNQVVTGTANGGCGGWAPEGYVVTLTYVCPGGAGQCGP